ncbi:hypothetical protein G210_5889, partial [Candida maltosa Xu316]
GICGNRSVWVCGLSAVGLWVTSPCRATKYRKKSKKKKKLIGHRFPDMFEKLQK